MRLECTSSMRTLCKVDPVNTYFVALQKVFSNLRIVMNIEEVLIKMGQITVDIQQKIISMISKTAGRVQQILQSHDTVWLHRIIIEKRHSEV